MTLLLPAPYLGVCAKRRGAVKGAEVSLAGRGRGWRRDRGRGRGHRLRVARGLLLLSLGAGLGRGLVFRHLKEAFPRGFRDPLMRTDHLLFLQLLLKALRRGHGAAPLCQRQKKRATIILRPFVCCRPTENLIPLRLRGVGPDVLDPHIYLFFALDLFES